VPTFTFQQDGYIVDEANKTANATVLRLGDLTLTAGVVCYTRQVTATVNMDYRERMQTNQSLLVFGPGERVSIVYSDTGWDV
jgi:hypothetical protein